MEGKLDFGNRPIVGLIWALFLPTLVGMVFTSLFLIVDGIFIGKGIGSAGLAAVNLFEPLLVLFIGIGTMIGAGCSIQAAMDLSQGKTDCARACVTRAYILVLAVCTAISLLLYIFPHEILVAIGATPTLEPIATEYYQWFVPSGCFLSIQIVAAFTIRLDGSPKFVMATNIVATAINLLLDYLFIFEFHMGMRGAAMATNIGSGVGVLMTIYYLAFLSRDIRPVRNIAISSSARILKLGSPSFLGEISSGIVSLLGNIMFGLYLSDTGIAAFSIICYLTPIVYTVFISLSSSIQPIISFNYGCGKTDRVSRTFRIGLVTSIGCAVLTATCIILFPDFISSVFLKRGIDAQILASSGLKLFAAAYLFSGVNTIIITYLQSIERIKSSMILTMLRSFVFITIAFVVMPHIAGHSGLWLAVPASEAVTFVSCCIALISNRQVHGNRPHKV